MSPQAKPKLLAIPGPIPLSPTVLSATALPPLSHVSPEFVEVMREALGMTRRIAQTTVAQPLILTGSGTLGWDQVGANLVQRGDRALVLSTGYFGKGFAECLMTYGADVDILEAPLGGTVSIARIEEALKGGYKMVTMTHVDTSTGVLADARGIAACVRRLSPDTLVVLDAVCSLASEQLKMDEWDIDVVFSASQKGLGAPPGLSILLASPRALQVHQKIAQTQKNNGGFYASWDKWLPIMRAYDAGKPAYFGTPAVTLIRGYHASLREILQSEGGLEGRLAAHELASAQVKSAAERLGLTQVALEAQGRAHGMTALYIPSELGASAVLGEVGKRGVVMAGGLVGPIKEGYIRIGHMGYSVAEGRHIIDKMVEALEGAVQTLRDGTRARL